MPLWCKDLMNETEKLQFMNLNSLLNFFLYPKLFLSISLRALFLENLPSHEISSFLRTKLSVALFEAFCIVMICACCSHSWTQIWRKLLRYSSLETFYLFKLFV